MDGAMALIRQVMQSTSQILFFIKSLYSQYPHCELITCGEAVGLPSGQMGNSEVGHMNIGAGRIVYQELMRINNVIKKQYAWPK